jgi:uncharacterized protein (DUF58 family)
VSLLLGFMAMSGWFGRSNLTRLEVSFELPEEIYAKRPTLGRIRLTNRRRWLPGFLLEVSCSGQQTLFPLVPAGASGQRSLEVCFARRGEQPLPEISLRSNFPVNFFWRRFSFRPAGAALVFPTPLPGEIPADESSPQALGAALSQLAGQDGELRAITDYQGGEPLKAIHWKLSARQDELKVKQHAGLSQTPVVIELARLPGHLEQRLSRASHLILGLARDNRPVGLRLAGKMIPAASGRQHKQTLLKELALYAEG